MNPTDESLNKNPIRNRMQFDSAPVHADELAQMVAAGRDQFHSYIAKTVKCSYRRPGIYLVDDWVTKALGTFQIRGDIKVLEERLAGASGPQDQPLPMEDFERLNTLFHPIGEFTRTVRQTGVLSFDDLLAKIWSLAVELPRLIEREARQSNSAELYSCVQEIVDAGRRLYDRLEMDKVLSPRVQRPWLADVVRFARDIADSLEHFTLSNPTGALRGFGASRSSGVVYEDLPSLDIRAPAVLLSPAAIFRWSRDELPAAPVERASAWLGNARKEDTRYALAIGNVVQHELLHVLVGLPSAGAEPDESQFRDQWRLYRKHPQIEEGMANFVAALVTANSIALTRSDLRHHQVVDFRKYGEEWAGAAHFVEALHRNYHREATEVFLRTWEARDHSLGDFGGALHAFSTHLGRTDWLRFLDALREGKILLTNM